RGARQVLLNITASREIGLHEMNEACSLIREACGSDDTHVSFGVIEKPGLNDEVRVTVIATGFPPAPPVIRDPAIEALPAEDFFAPRDPNAAPPAPVVAPAPVPEPVKEPEPVLAGASHT